MADSYFVVDIGEKFTKVADAKKTGDILEVNGITKIDTPEFYYATDDEKNLEEEADKIKKAVESLKLNKKNVNLIIPDSFSYSQILSMPLLNEKELISAIRYQADQFIPMPIEETNIDIEVIEESPLEKKLLILIVAAPKKIIEKIQSTAELSGLIPESVENELSSSARFVSVFYKNILNEFKINSSQGLTLVNFSLDSTSMFYFNKERYTLQENHSFPIGYQLFLKEIQINTGTLPQKAAEILKTYDKTGKSSYPVEKIIGPLLKEYFTEIKRFITKNNSDHLFFINNIFLFSSLARLIGENLSIPSVILNPFNLIKKTPLVDGCKDELPLFLSTLGGNLR